MDRSAGARAQRSRQLMESLEARTLLSVASGPVVDRIATQMIDWQGRQLEVMPGQWIVRFGAPTNGMVSRRAFARLELAEVMPSAVLGDKLGQKGLFRVEVPASKPTANVFRKLSRMDGLRYVIPDAVVRIQSTFPDDVNFSELYGLHNTGQTGGTVDADIDAPEAWDLTTGSANVVMGVIDTGLDYTHPDLADNVWINPGEIAGNGIDDDGNGYVDDVRGWDFANNDNDPMDDHGHGTHVSGTIAGRGNNAQGVAGVTWNTKIMALKFLNADGSGAISDAVKAINYATWMRQHGVNIVATNNSWGGGGSDTAVYNAIRLSGDAGMLFVAAAGNDGLNNDLTPVYPASYDLDNIITVAATDAADELAGFSNFGQSVDLAAPGVLILSAKPGGGYQQMSGTSMATPHVAGVVALAFAYSPLSSWQQVKSAILDSVDKPAGIADMVATNGRLNAYGTLMRLGMAVASSTPRVGQHVSTRYSEFTVGFAYKYAPATVQASDFTVNGIAASSVSFVDEYKLKFTFPTSPMTVGEGPQVMHMAADSVLRLDGDGIDEWTGTFYYDLSGAQVVSQTPTGLADINQAAIDLTFSEEMDRDSFSLAQVLSFTGPDGEDLKSQITGFQWTDIDQLQLNIIPSAKAGTFTIVLSAGIKDSAGNAMDQDQDGTAGESVQDRYTGQFEQYKRVSIVTDPFTSNRGWTFTSGSKWAVGVPQGGGSGNWVPFEMFYAPKDPTSGHTGKMVLGYNLDGDYTNLMPAEYATSPAFSTLGYDHVTLSYWRWLGVERSRFDGATISVSTDGTNWTLIWNNKYDEGVFDDAWTLHEVALPAEFDNQPTVYVRYRMGTTDNMITGCGWNIDDLSLTGRATRPFGQLITPTPEAATNQNLGYVDVRWTDYTRSGLNTSTIGVGDITIAGRTITSVLDQGNGIWRYFYTPGLSTNGLVTVNFVEGQVAATDGTTNIARSDQFTYDTVGPKVVSHTPTGTLDHNQTTMRLVFNEEVNWGSFSAADDIASFTGPGGTNLKSQITSSKWLDEKTLQIKFNPVAAGGSFTLVLGPNITDMAGNAMNQDSDATNGEATQDQYSASFSQFSRVTIYSADMSADPLWTLDPGSGNYKWEWGKPQGKGGWVANNDANSGPDPLTGKTGDFVLGYNLNGGYENSMSATQWATSPAVNCSGYSDVELEFWRWLNIESYDDDKATIQVSNNGTTWTTVYTNTAGYAQFTLDTSWKQQFINISSVAANQPTVYIRFGMGSTDMTRTRGGWNVDDLKLTAKADRPVGQLVFPAPGTAVKNDAGYVDVRWDDFSSTGLNASTIGAADLSITGVTVSSVEARGDNVWRYYYSGTLPGGTVSVTMNAGQVAATNGTTNAVKTDTFLFVAGGPKVTAQTPTGSLGTAQTRMRFSFDQPMDPTSFAVADDVVRFTGPGGTNLKNQITGFNWLSANTLEVIFNSQSAAGAYSMVLGPKIANTAGMFMNQDGDILDGENFADRYTGGFSLYTPATIAFYNMSTNPGWTLDSGRWGTPYQWQWGTSTQDGWAEGPNKSYDNSTTFLGYNLNGASPYNGTYTPPDVSKTLTATEWATTPVIDCSGYDQVKLGFYRWLDVYQNDSAKIEVSADNGATWTSIWNWTTGMWDGGTGGYNNVAGWRYVEYDLSAIASGKSQVKVRFGIGPAAGWTSWTGWNIDDVKLFGRSTTPPAGADLLGTAFAITPDNLADAAGTASANFTILNQGSQNAGTFKVKFYRSADGVIDPATSTLLNVNGAASYTISGLTAGTSQTLNVSLSVPATSPWADSGGYIGMIIDADGQVSETDEANNSNRGPDLDVDEVYYQFYRDADAHGALVNGLGYRYYFTGGDLTSVDTLDGLTPIQQGNASGFDISQSVRDDDFGYSWQGFVFVPTQGVYTFYTNSDEGSKLYIGDTLVVNNDGGHAAQEQLGQIGLKAGYHRLTVKYFENRGEQSIGVSYAGPGISKRAIPASALFRDPAPQVSGVLVGSSAWSSGFINAVGGTGFAIGTQQWQTMALPWNNIDRISIRFSEDVVVNSDVLTLHGVNNATYSFSGFSYDADSFTATWTLSAPLPTDRLLLSVSDAVIDSAGSKLDGEWTNGASLWPSGNGVAGGAFGFRFNVLVGDVNGSGVVNSLDLSYVLNKQGLTVGQAGFWQKADLDGDGVIDGDDLLLVMNQQAQQLPVGEPA